MKTHLPFNLLRQLFKLIALTILIFPTICNCQSFPDKPVQIIVPYAPAGLTDNIARFYAQQLKDIWTQTILVENRPGAGASLGAAHAARSNPDGYTILLGSVGMVTNPFLFKELPYKSSDLSPIALVAFAPNVLYVHSSIPARNVVELVNFAKKNPGILSFASAGVGSSPHLAAELFASSAGIKILHIPYKGNQDALNDVLSGQITMTFSGLQPLLSNIQAGKVKALVVAGDKRMSAIADVPTVAELGLKGAEVMPWYGVIAPAGTPTSIVNLLNKVIVEIMARPEIFNQFKANGSEPNTGTPAQFGELISSDVLRWGDVIKRAGIQTQ